MTRAAAAGIHVDTTFATRPSWARSYAQPLYVGGAGTSQPDMVVVTTAQSRVYALNASNRRRGLARRRAGRPAGDDPAGTSAASNRPLLPLAWSVRGPSIPPRVRSTSTRRNNVSSTIRHRIHALDLTNGMEKTGWPVVTETAASAASRRRTRISAARRALVGGRVFVPYSGHIGDAGRLPRLGGRCLDDDADRRGVVVDARARVRRIWATGGISSEGTNVIFTTGNTKASASGWLLGRRPPTATARRSTSWAPTWPRTTTATDFWVPSNWSSLDSSDTDISGSAVVLFDGAGATPSALALVLAKDGNAYLLNRTNMGGMSGAPVRTLKVANGTIIQAAAAYTTAMGTYFVFRGGVTGCPTGSTGGLMAVRVTAASPPQLTPAWCGGPSQASNPSRQHDQRAGRRRHRLGSSPPTARSTRSTRTRARASSAATPSRPRRPKGHQSPIIANGRLIHSTDTRVFALTP
jgi:hypothetical protein